MTLSNHNEDKIAAKEATTPIRGSPTTPRLDPSLWTSEKDLIHRNGVDVAFGRCFDQYDAETQFFYIGNNGHGPKTPAQKDSEQQQQHEGGDAKAGQAPPRKMSTRQLLVVVSCMMANLVSASCVSLQAPFYPAEAEKKGATASQYGLVFGIFELVVFIVSPLYGKYIGKIGPKFLMSAGIFLTAGCCILFGLLDKIQDLQSFLALSFAVRIVEATGQAGYLTGSFTIIAQEFPEKVSTAFAFLEMSFGVGLIIGPTIGGLLYEVGGYTLPFAVMGSILLAATVFTLFFLPVKESSSEPNPLNMLHLFRVPSINIAGFSTFSASVSIGFLLALLEPHLRQFSLSPVTMGVMFVINGGLYAFTTPVWGKLCEKKISPCLACGIGGVFMCCSYLLLGPSPIMPFGTLLPVCILGLVFHGLGIAAELVGSFSLAHRDAVKHGFPDDLKTYGMVSGFWTSVFALGAFVGPSVGGVLMDNIGFASGSQVILMVHFILVCLTFWWILCGQPKRQVNDGTLSAKDEPGSLDEKLYLVY